VREFIFVPAKHGSAERNPKKEHPEREGLPNRLHNPRIEDNAPTALVS
jgi:hypothetical protein